MSATRVICSWHTNLSTGYKEPCFKVQAINLGGRRRTLGVFEDRADAIRYSYERSKEGNVPILVRSHEGGIDTTPPDEEDFDA